jgi:S-DNA-T family DNA segregation ATPase FtsK/SpoIIIE
MYQEIPNDFGYVIKNGKVSLVKLLASETEKEEVAVFG